MAFSRDDLATYEQQPQTQVEIQAPVVEVAADAPPAEETPAADAATPAADGADADDTAEGGSSADEVEGEPATPSGEPSAATDAPRGSARARIMELVDQRDAYKKFGSVAEQRIADLQAQLDAAKGVKPAPVAETPAAETTSADDDQAPSPEDADVQYDPVKLQQKNAKWIREQVAKGVKTEVAKAQTVASQEATFAETKRVLESRIIAYEATDAGKGLRVLIGNTELPQLDAPARAMIVKDEFAPQILHELAKDVKEAKRIAALPAGEQLVELGEIRARVRIAAKTTGTTTPATVPSKPVKQPKTVSSAPPPPTRVPAGAAAQTRSLSDPSLSMEEFVRLDREAKNADRAAKREARFGKR